MSFSTPARTLVLLATAADAVSVKRRNIVSQATKSVASWRMVTGPPLCDVTGGRYDNEDFDRL